MPDVCWYSDLIWKTEFQLMSKYQPETQKEYLVFEIGNDNCEIWLLILKTNRKHS